MIQFEKKEYFFKDHFTAHCCCCDDVISKIEEKKLAVIKEGKINAEAI